MDRADKKVPRETARRVLQVAAVEAHGRPEAYVTQAHHVMGRADMVDLEGFKAIAAYLERKGWIAAADAGYIVVAMFVAAWAISYLEVWKSRGALERRICG